MKVTFITLFIALSFTTAAQVTQQWAARYDGPTNFIDSARNLIVDNSGNVYVTGSSRGTTGWDYTTLKYNSAGALLWEARYDGPAHGEDDARWIASDNSGNIYVTGSSRSITGFDDFATVKYNSDGVMQWDARYNGPGNNNDKALKVIADNFGNVYVTGLSNGSGTSLDYATIKYNSAGIQQWAVRYNGPGNAFDSPEGIVVDNNGNVFVTGTSQSANAIGSEDYLTIKYNSNGAEQWAVRHNGPANYSDVAESMTIDGSGNIYVTGSCYSTATLNDYVTIKYSSSGQQLWLATYNGPLNNSDIPAMIVLDNNGNTYVTGRSPGNGTSIDYATIKYDQQGNQLWAARYNGPENNYDMPNSVAVDQAGNVYVTGKEVTFGAIYDYTTVKYNSAGTELWVTKFNGASNLNDGATSVKVDDMGNVYVTGNSVSANGSDFLTIKYSGSGFTGNNGNGSEIPDNYALMQNYPNPFNPVTNISFQLPKSGHVKLTVFDNLGSETAVLMNENLVPGSYNVRFDGSGVSSGIYFYRLETPDFAETRKMILIK